MNTTIEDVYELIDYILNHNGTTCISEYCRTRITSNEATNIAFSDPAACQYYFEANPMEPELIMNHLVPKELAYHLAFTESTKATELLEELMYYRNAGRI